MLLEFARGRIAQRECTLASGTMETLAPPSANASHGCGVRSTPGPPTRPMRQPARQSSLAPGIARRLRVCRLQLGAGQPCPSRRAVSIAWRVVGAARQAQAHQGHDSADPHPRFRSERHRGPAAHRGTTVQLAVGLSDASQ